MTISIGSTASDRGSSLTVTYTMQVKNNPANESGTITKVEVWANSNLSNFEVATFYYIGAGAYTRDNETIGSVTAGSKQTFTVSIECQTDDVIGYYGTAGDIENDTSGGGGGDYKVGDYIPCSDEAFTNIAGYEFSLYGYSEAAAGWTHGYIGVANAAIGTVSGTAKASVKTVDGVA